MAINCVILLIWPPTGGPMCDGGQSCHLLIWPPTGGPIKVALNTFQLLACSAGGLWPSDGLSRWSVFSCHLGFAKCGELGWVKEGSCGAGKGWKKPPPSPSLTFLPDSNSLHCFTLAPSLQCFPNPRWRLINTRWNIQCLLTQNTPALPAKILLKVVSQWARVPSHWARVDHFLVDERVTVCFYNFVCLFVFPQFRTVTCASRWIRHLASSPNFISFPPYVLL